MPYIEFFRLLLNPLELAELSYKIGIINLLPGSRAWGYILIHF